MKKESCESTTHPFLNAILLMKLKIEVENLMSGFHFGMTSTAHGGNAALQTTEKK